MKEEVGREIASRIKGGEIIGVGTGSTVDAAITQIGERIKREKLSLAIVPTSYETAKRCESLGITVLHPSFGGKIAWGFDGADAVDEKLRAIKGKGGALLKEKILAVRCEKFVIIVDESKVGENIAEKSEVPIEVIPEAASYVTRRLNSLKPISIHIREGSGKFGAVITEGGNMILDVKFKEIGDELETEIKSITGVVESGLFLSQAHELLIASPSGIKKISR